MAVQPSYNLNLFYKTAPDVRRNRCVADAFEPGSTFKVFLAAALMDLGKISPGEKFYCHNGVYRYQGHEIHDIVPQKNLTFEEVIIHSSNIGAVKMSDKLSRGELYRVLQGFGFGAPTQVDLPGERPGSLPVPGRWSTVTKGNIAFGQGLSLNAIQLCAAFAAAVNGGSLYRPYLMKRVTNALGETVRENRPVQVRKVIKPSTSTVVVDVLASVVTKGTGKAAAIPGVQVVGKTGTAQKADRAGGYAQDKYVASFIGALMSIKPRLVILVVLDEPGVKHRTGGKVAAPLFRRISEGILASCGSAPTNQDLVIASSPGAFPGAGAAPYKSVKVRKGHNPDEWIVPDLKGLNMRQVVEVCGKMKCEASFQGTGHVESQDPKPGSVLKEGASLAVSFKGDAI